MNLFHKKLPDKIFPQIEILKLILEKTIKAIGCDVQCPTLNMVTLGWHKSHKNKRMITLTDTFCGQFIYKRPINV